MSRDGLSGSARRSLAGARAGARPDQSHATKPIAAPQREPTQTLQHRLTRLRANKQHADVRRHVLRRDRGVILIELSGWRIACVRRISHLSLAAVGTSVRASWSRLVGGGCRQYGLIAPAPDRRVPRVLPRRF